MASILNLASKLYLQYENNKFLNCKNCKTNRKWIDTVTELLDSNIETGNQLVPLPGNTSVKSLTIALKHKDTGNKLFVSKNYCDAIRAYSKGILYAPWENSDLAILFANRSACLYHCNQYRDALKDIEAAFNHEYPNKLLYKILHRAGLCSHKLKRYSDAVEYFNKGIAALDTSQLNNADQSKWKAAFVKDLQLSEEFCAIRGKESVSETTNFRKLAPFSGLSPSLGITSSTTFGRYVVANDDINTGDILVSESPFCFVLLAEHYSSKCMRCLKKVINLFPCRQCTTVTYCSLECEQRDWEVCHQYECQYMQYFNSKSCSRIGHLAIRLFTQMVKDIIHEFMNEEQKQREDTLQCNDYQNILSLVSHEGNRDIEVSLQMTLLAILLRNIVFTNGVVEDALKKVNVDFSDKVLMSRFSSFAVERMLKHLQIIQCNAFAITEMDKTDDLKNSKPVDFALAIYPRSSFFNHSCDPNVEISFNGSNIQAHAIKHMAKGEQVYCDYGFVFYSDDKKKRQDELKIQYLFECNCIACIKDWPLFEQIECKVPTLKCQQCHCPLDLSTNADRLEIHCSNPCCYNTENLINNLEELTKSHTLYTEGMQQAMEGHYTNALPLLIAHLNTMDRFICKPWREYYSCQATIKQCYRLSVNTA